MQILVVDDSASVRALLREVLEKEGYVVFAEEKAERAAELVLSIRPAAVVSDLFMPGISGLQLCRLLQDDPATRDVPVILISAAGDKRAQFWASRSGAAAFLEKSQIDRLLEVLKDVVTDSPASAEPMTMKHARGSVSERLSVLLDRTLFYSEVTGELRALATTASDLDALMLSLTNFLAALLPLRWVALSIATDRVCELRVVSAPGSEPVLPPTELPVARRMDHECDTLMPGGPATKWQAPLLLAGETLGTLTVGLATPMLSRDDGDLLQLVAREAPVAVRLVGLLERTRELACTDMLTGVANRRHGELILQQAVAAAMRHKTPLTVIMVDIDHFKRINDQFGHLAGDEAIKQVSAVLRQTCRKSDTLIRWGGEEFLLVLPDARDAGARIAGERFRMAVAAGDPPSEAPLPLTVSLGIASWEGESLQSLVKRADLALYAAKRAGRNRAEVAPKPDPAEPNP